MADATKPKRPMSEAQKAQLAKARAKLAERRKSDGLTAKERAALAKGAFHKAAKDAKTEALREGGEIPAIAQPEQPAAPAGTGNERVKHAPYPDQPGGGGVDGGAAAAPAPEPSPLDPLQLDQPEPTPNPDPPETERPEPVGLGQIIVKGLYLDKLMGGNRA